MQKYHLEFILHTYVSSVETIKNYLAEFSDVLAIAASVKESQEAITLESVDLAKTGQATALRPVDCQDTGEKGENYKISLSTDEPTIIFDVCSQFGRIREIKIDEVATKAVP